VQAEEFHLFSFNFKFLGMEKYGGQTSAELYLVQAEEFRMHSFKFPVSSVHGNM
jgi:hypothetical protein